MPYNVFSDFKPDRRNLSENRKVNFTEDLKNPYNFRVIIVFNRLLLRISMYGF